MAAVSAAASRVAPLPWRTSAEPQVLHRRARASVLGVAFADVPPLAPTAADDAR